MMEDLFCEAENDKIKFVSVRCDRHEDKGPQGLTVFFKGSTPSVNIDFADMPTKGIATSPDNVRGMWQYCMAWAIREAVKRSGGSPRLTSTIKNAINAGTEEVIAERAAEALEETEA